jgi:hypothetical protein
MRAETLKLRELDYVQAARAFGVSDARIMARHILPNLMHIVLIALVMDFSGLVLSEAVLSYIGIGVDTSMNSFGTMINTARWSCRASRWCGGRWPPPSCSCWRWCWRPTCLPTPCATPSIRASSGVRGAPSGGRRHERT